MYIHLGVIVNESFSFCQHVEQMIKQAHQRFYMAMKLSSRDTQFMGKSFIIYIRLGLEYTSQVYILFRKYDFVALESVLRQFSRCIPKFRPLLYADQCSALHHVSLKLRCQLLNKSLFYKMLYKQTATGLFYFKIKSGNISSIRASSWLCFILSNMSFQFIV